MVPIVSLLFILGISLFITRVASVMLEHTGLSRDAARFQARSAFTGVGFTTSEAERIVDHPVRRRVVMWLMLVGNVGIVSAMAALLLSATDLQTSEGVGILVAWFVGGILVLWWLGTSRWVDRYMCATIGWAIKHWTSIETEDYVHLLHLRDDYAVARFRVEEGDWVGGQTVAASDVVAEGIVVLGIECPGGHFVGVPAPDVEIRVDDVLLVYGRSAQVAALERRSHDSAAAHGHEEAIRQRRAREGAERAQVGR